VLGLRKLSDVAAGILEGDKLAAAGQGDRFLKLPLPTAISHEPLKIAVHQDYYRLFFVEPICGFATIKF
jgi:hypothetical protein